MINQTEKKIRIQFIANLLAEYLGTDAITRKIICEKAKVPEGSFTYIMGTPFSKWHETLKVVPKTSKAARRSLPASIRKQLILSKAVQYATLHGTCDLRGATLARYCDVSPGTLYYHFKNIATLRNQISKKLTEKKYSMCKTRLNSHTYKTNTKRSIV